MPIIKYRPPNTELPKYGGGSLDFSKWKVNLEKLKTLKIKCQNLISIFDDFPNFTFLPITLSFSKIIPKSKRIKLIFKNKLKKPSQIGSTYVFDSNNEISKINLVYSCTKEDIIDTLNSITKVISALSPEIIFQINDIHSKKENMKIKNQALSKILNNTKLWKLKYVLNDLMYIENIDIVKLKKYDYSPIISIYDIIDFNVFKEMLAKDNIIITDDEIVADEFLNINIDDLNKIIDKYPFIISKAADNIEIIFKDTTTAVNQKIDILQSKKNGERIGIIDSMCVLHDNWTSYHQNGTSLLPSYLENNLYHGTGVTSLIIGRDFLNNYFTDNLGEFNVKTFEVMPNGKINTFYLMKSIEKIIKENSDIKIWNLSLGGKRLNSKLSVFGKLLDILQYKYDVQFIVSSGNNGSNNLSSPADSLSAISVGALYETKLKTLKISSYTGTGNVFGIFKKPSTYELGNDLKAEDSSNNFLQFLNPDGTKLTQEGTSFAAPLVTRKVAYLKEKYSINLETSRAIINYLTKISSNKIADLSLIESKDFFIFIEGEISAGQKNEIPVQLPFNFDTNRTMFTIGCSVSYNIANTKNLGDEYSCVEISIKLMKKTKDEHGKVSCNNIINSASKLTVEGKNANEKDLREAFGKYDPNKVFVDKDFNTKKGIKINNLASFSFRAERIDLFTHTSVPIKYGAIIHLKETEEGSLNNFIKLNEENIIEVITSQEIELEI